MTEQADKKRALREAASQRRRALNREEPDAGQRLVEHFAAVPVPQRAAIAGFIPTRSEIDVTVLMEHLRAKGHDILLPRVVAKGEPLAFHIWSAGAKPVPAPFGLLEPEPDWPQALPDMVLVAMLAFDKDGYRLGYGGGFYDRTLAALKAKRNILAVGIAYAGQEVESVPREAWDQPLDWLVTEEGARRFEG